MIGVFGVLFPSVDQSRRVPLVVAEMQFSISLVPVCSPLEKTLGLGFLAGLHPFGHHVGQTALTQHLEDVLAVELPVHQHIIDVNEILCRV